MAFLAAAAPYFADASTALAVGGAIHQGEVAKVQSEIQARELREDANASQAVAQRVAIQRRRQGVFAASRARAVAVASGAGLGDTTAETLVDRIDAQSDLNVLNALYEGDTTAKGLRDDASTKLREGRAARRGSRYRALGSAISGASSFADKYGDDGGGGGDAVGAFNRSIAISNAFGP